MKALLVGGSGYLGSLLMEINLRESVYTEIYCIDKELPVVGCELFTHADILSMSDDQIKRSMLGIDDVFLMASAVGKDLLHEEKSLYNLNFSGLARFVLLAPPDTRIIFFSSAAVFEGYDTIAAHESAAPSPRSSYAKYKWMMENFLFRYSQNFTIFRLASCFGRSPNFKIHTLVNQILSALEEVVTIQAHRRTKVSIVHASSALKAILTICKSGSKVDPVQHIGGEFLEIEYICSRILEKKPVLIELSDSKPAVHGYKLVTSRGVTVNDFKTFDNFVDKL